MEFWHGLLCSITIATTDCYDLSGTFSQYIWFLNFLRQDARKPSVVSGSYCSISSPTSVMAPPPFPLTSLSWLIFFIYRYLPRSHYG